MNQAASSLRCGRFHAVLTLTLAVFSARASGASAVTPILREGQARYSVLDPAKLPPGHRPETFCRRGQRQFLRCLRARPARAADQHRAGLRRYGQQGRRRKHLRARRQRHPARRQPGRVEQGRRRVQTVGDESRLRTRRRRAGGASRGSFPAGFRQLRALHGRGRQGTRVRRRHQVGKERAAHAAGLALAAVPHGEGRRGALLRRGPQPGRRMGHLHLRHGKQRRRAGVQAAGRRRHAGPEPGRDHGGEERPERARDAVHLQPEDAARGGLGHGQGDHPHPGRLHGPLANPAGRELDALHPGVGHEGLDHGHPGGKAPLRPAGDVDAVPLRQPDRQGGDAVSLQPATGRAAGAGLERVRGLPRGRGQRARREDGRRRVAGRGPGPAGVRRGRGDLRLLRPRRARRGEDGDVLRRALQARGGVGAGKAAAHDDVRRAVRRSQRRAQNRAGEPAGGDRALRRAGSQAGGQQRG